MFLNFQSICILSSILLIIFNESHNHYAFLLFVVGVLTHTLEGVYYQYNLNEERKSNTILNMFDNFKSDIKKDKIYQNFIKDWEKEKVEGEKDYSDQDE